MGNMKELIARAFIKARKVPEYTVIAQSSASVHKPREMRLDKLLPIYQAYSTDGIGFLSQSTTKLDEAADYVDRLIKIDKRYKVRRENGYGQIKITLNAELPAKIGDKIVIGEVLDVPGLYVIVESRKRDRVKWVNL